MKICITLVLILAFPFVCLADDEREIGAVMQANFDASNLEDVDALMDTCSVDMPNREEFRADSANLWREKDIYYRLLRLKIIQIEGDYATASIVQETMVKDRGSKSGRDRFIRNGTGLLSDSECVEYKVAFKKDRGVWKCYMTLTPPVDFDPARLNR
jgi:hypothetical protein